MSKMLFRVVVVLFGVVSLTGCDSCEARRQPPVTQGPAQTAPLQG